MQEEMVEPACMEGLGYVLSVKMWRAPAQAKKQAELQKEHTEVSKSIQKCSKVSSLLCGRSKRGFSKICRGSMGLARRTGRAAGQSTSVGAHGSHTKLPAVRPAVRLLGTAAHAQRPVASEPLRRLSFEALSLSEPCSQLRMSAAVRTCGLQAGSAAGKENRCP